MRKRWTIIFLVAWLGLGLLSGCTTTNAPTEGQKEPAAPFKLPPPEEDY